MRDVSLPQGVVRYRESGSGEPIVFVHGAFVDGRLWRKVVAELEPDFRCIVPDMPLGAHQVALGPDADRSPVGVADLLADFLDALDLEDVTLVGNDTGGALCQFLVTRRPERVGRLVLTPCDAFDNFLPPMFKPMQVLAKVPPLLLGFVQPMRLAPVRKLPIAFGWLTKHGLDPAIEADWVGRFFSSRPVQRDAIAFLAAVDAGELERAGEQLAGFEKPALVAWTPEDKVFPFAHAERLARTLPDARLERIEDARSFVPEDQPRRVAELVRDFVRETRTVAA